MILVDTSVWVDHLQKGVPELVEVLERQEAVTHPFIIGELACGNIRNRHEVLDLLSALPEITVATHEEVLLFIEKQRLLGRGLGYVDAHLLASVALSAATELWTRDKQLAAAALRLKNA